MLARRISIKYKILIALGMILILLQIISNSMMFNNFYNNFKSLLTENIYNELEKTHNIISGIKDLDNNSFSSTVEGTLQQIIIKDAIIYATYDNFTFYNVDKYNNINESNTKLLNEQINRTDLLSKEIYEKGDYIFIINNTTNLGKNLTMVAIIEKNEIWAELHQTIKIGIITCIISWIICQIVANLTTEFMIVKPLNLIRDIMLKIANGDLSPIIPMTSVQNELGDIMRAILVFKDKTFENQILEKEREKDIIKQRKEKQAILDNLIKKFQESVVDIIQEFICTSTQVEQKVNSLSSSAKISVEKSSMLHKIADESAHNISQVASSTEKLNISINDVRSRIIKSNEITSTAVEKVNKANTTVSNLNQASGKIGEVLETINSIAAQISLLALNATIEAARAGEAGKGFSVVASEVKNLAAQTSQATEEIIKVINTMQQETVNTVNAMSNITTVIAEVNDISIKLLDTFTQQTETIITINHNANNAATNSNKVIEESKEMNKISNTNGSDSAELATAIKEITNKSKVLQQELDKFISNARQEDRI